MRRLLTRARWTAVVLLLAAAAALPTAAHGETAMIRMSTEGFSPPTVTVHAGSLVRFVNTDASPHWPASDVHPLHDRYPAFDPRRPVPPGESWLFRPTKTGTWRYHDHLFPHRKGMLTVVPEAGTVASAASPAPTAAPAVRGETAVAPAGGGWRASLRDALGRLGRALRRFFGEERVASAPKAAAAFQTLDEAAQYRFVKARAERAGVGAAWAFVKRQYTDARGASLGGRAHDLAHYVGTLIFEREGLAGLTRCDATFAFGCFHGFTEAAFQDSLDRLPEVARACETIGAVASGPWASCIHGIGHGLATFYGFADVSPPLTTCDTLPAGAPYCHDGVLMEFAFSAPRSFYRAADPLFPCSTLPPRYAQACGRNQPLVLERHHRLDRRAISAVCLRARPEIAEACIDAIGFAVANQFPSDPDAIARACGELPAGRPHAQCAAAAAGELVFQNAPQWETAAAAVCAALPPPSRADCQARVARTAAQYRKRPGPP